MQEPQNGEEWCEGGGREGGKESGEEGTTSLKRWFVCARLSSNIYCKSLQAEITYRWAKEVEYFRLLHLKIEQGGSRSDVTAPNDVTTGNTLSFKAGGKQLQILFRSNFIYFVINNKTAIYGLKFDDFPKVTQINIKKGFKETVRNNFRLVSHSADKPSLLTFLHSSKYIFCCNEWNFPSVG